MYAKEGLHSEHTRSYRSHLSRGITTIAFGLNADTEFLIVTCDLQLRIRTGQLTRTVLAKVRQFQ